MNKGQRTKLAGKIDTMVSEICEQLKADRRDFHRYPESAWTEFRTASLAASRLVNLGYDVEWGRAVTAGLDRMGVPDENTLKDAYQRSVIQGADMRYAEGMAGGYTGVVATLDCGPGPTIALRFDMDANILTESSDPQHRPGVHGFASGNIGIMHACGHDAHTAVGLGVAKVLAEHKKELKLKGKIKLIFQPAEEGVRGAKSMVAAGVVEDVDVLIGGHIMSNIPPGMLICAADGFMATTKFDVTFTGVGAHAGSAPNEGRNAMLAACSAVLNLSAIPRHRAGDSRVNVGVIQSGTDRNIVPDRAWIQVETRGQTTEINDYMHDYAKQVVDGAARMHGVVWQLEYMGATCGGVCSEALAQKVEIIAAELGDFDQIVPRTADTMGSEDFMLMMRRVQELGGQATYVILGTPLIAGHHLPDFDIDEAVMTKMVKLFIGTVVESL